MNGAQLEWRLVAGLHLQKDSDRRQPRHHRKDHVAQRPPGWVLHQCPDRPNQFPGTLFSSRKDHKYPGYYEKHVHAHQASGNRLSQQQIKHRPERQVDATDYQSCLQ